MLWSWRDLVVLTFGAPVRRCNDNERERRTDVTSTAAPRDHVWRGGGFDSHGRREAMPNPVSHTPLAASSRIFAGGCEPVGFTEVAEAVQAYAVQARFDAALVSHQRGAASGLDFATALHDIAPNLPIILATPSARDLDAPRLAASGISEVVHHPLTSAQLAGALSRCLPVSVAVRRDPTTGSRFNRTLSARRPGSRYRDPRWPYHRNNCRTQWPKRSPSG
jgi:CheY-like chemotaxis protein